MKHKTLTLLTALLLSHLAASAQYSVEYFWDKDPGVGHGNTLGTFKNPVDSLSKSISVSGLSFGMHKLGLRALNTQVKGTTYWSETQYRNIIVPTAEQNISRLEYFWDTDPGLGKGTEIKIDPSTSSVDVSGNISTKGLAAGMHRLWLRAKSQNLWSAFDSRLVYVYPTLHKLQDFEYFWDNDPGVGNGTKVAISSDNDSAKVAMDIPTYGLTNGVHRLGMRALTDGTWSETQTRLVLVQDVREDQISYLEYFWDTDPGQGNGRSIAITPAGEISLETSLTVSKLTGWHVLYLRAQAGNSTWSDPYLAGEIEIVGEFSGDHSDEDYVLDDAQKAYSSTDISGAYKSIAYSRTYADTNWQTLYLPVSLSYNEWSNNFDVARLNDVHQYDDNGDGTPDRTELEAFIVESGSLNANTPYLIKSKKAGKQTITALEDPTLYNTQVYSYDCTSMNARYVFTGNYSTVSGSTMVDNGYYILTDNCLVPATSNQSLQPFRWYLTMEKRNGFTQQPAAVKISVINLGGEDHPTSIHCVEPTDNTAPAEVTGYYTLEGKKISTLQRGITIIRYADGTARKMIVK